MPNVTKKILATVIKNIPLSFYDALERVVRIQRLSDKAYKAGGIMTTNSFEDYYERITSFWPPNSIINSTQPWKYSFIEKLGNIENMMLADQLNYMPDDILVKVDRASMSQSLETRAPLLDHKIAEFAWSLPSEMRIDNKGGKRILREILYKYVPENLVDRPKQGFGLPVNKWLRNMSSKIGQWIYFV